MTITIDLPGDTLAALRADAAAQGRPAERVAAEHLAALYTDEDDEDVALAEALAELGSGQGRPFTEFASEFAARFTARYGAP
jgi:plasmid stability protein